MCKYEINAYKSSLTLDPAVRLSRLGLSWLLSLLLSHVGLQAARLQQSRDEERVLHANALGNRQRNRLGLAGLATASHRSLDVELSKGVGDLEGVQSLLALHDRGEELLDGAVVDVDLARLGGVVRARHINLSAGGFSPTNRLGASELVQTLAEHGCHNALLTTGNATNVGSGHAVLVLHLIKQVAQCRRLQLGLDSAKAVEQRIELLLLLLGEALLGLAVDGVRIDPMDLFSEFDGGNVLVFVDQSAQSPERLLQGRVRHVEGHHAGHNPQAVKIGTSMRRAAVLHVARTLAGGDGAHVGILLLELGSEVVELGVDDGASCTRTLRRAVLGSTRGTPLENKAREGPEHQNRWGV